MRHNKLFSSKNPNWGQSSKHIISYKHPLTNQPVKNMNCEPHNGHANELEPESVVELVNDLTREHVDHVQAILSDALQKKKNDL